MVLYYLIVFVLFVLSNKYDGKAGAFANKRNKYALFFVVMLLFLAGLSKGIGADVTNVYEPEYHDVPTLSNLTLDYINHPGRYTAGSDRYRPLYIITRSFFRSFSDQFWFYHLFHALFINLVIYFFLRKRSSYLFLSLVFYLLTNFLEYNTEIIRESLAVACGLVLFDNYEKKKYLWSVLWGAIAIGFHSSAFVLLLVPLLSILNRIQAKYIIPFFIVIAFSVPVLYQRLDINQYLTLLDSDIATNAEYYLQVDTAEGANINSYLLFYFSFLVIPLFLMMFSGRDSQYPYLGFVYLYLFLRLFAMHSMMFYRFANYYSPFYWMFLAYSSGVISLRFKGSGRGLFIALVVALFIAFQVYYLLGGDNAGLGPHIYDRYFPYKSILFN